MERLKRAQNGAKNDGERLASCRIVLHDDVAYVTGLCTFGGVRHAARQFRSPAGLLDASIYKPCTSACQLSGKALNDVVPCKYFNVRCQ